MSPTDEGSSARAHEIQVVLDQCVDRLAEGESVTKEQVIAAHPALMPELGEELRKLSLIERAQRLARDAGSSSGIGATVEAKGEPLIKDGDTIPGYRILRELHRGGQGIVYEAFQESTRRKVAVKVMKEGPFAGPADEARFSREVQVLGQLRHPNIVAIHDSGSSAGHHYFAMDYVPGQPLDAHMASARPSLDETLRLFAKICEAVNAAHLRGVIHRDLKPGNIRIDTDGEPRILDFGLAKVAVPDVWHSGPPLSAQPGAAGPQPMTMTGQFLGSLPWASPEQAEAVPSKIEVRTDVYSLGVILYHMLTGKFPYDVLGNMRDVIDNILTVEPVRPSTIRGNGDRLTRRINDEVETIVLKCLQKERDRRYQTAGELARDVNHYLNGEPIEAKRDSLAYVLRKQLKRYRIPAVIAASFIVLVTAGLIVSVTFWQQAGAERDEAQRQAEIARVVNEFLNEDLLASVDPAVARGREVTVREVLDAAAEKIDGAFPNQPEVEASLRETIGLTYYRLGDVAAAAAQHSARLETLRRALGQNHPETHRAAVQLAGMWAEQGRLEEAEQMTRAALESQEGLLPEDDIELAVTMNNLAWILMARGKLSEVEPFLDRAAEVYGRALGEDHANTLRIVKNMAAMLNEQDKHEEAKSLCSQALDRAQAALGDDHPGTLELMHTLAIILSDRGEFEEAERLYRDAYQIRVRVLGEEHPGTLVSLGLLGAFHAEVGQLDEAERVLTQVLEPCERALGKEHPQTLDVVNNLGIVFIKQGQFDEATALFVELLESKERALGQEHPSTLATMNNLGLLYKNQKRYEEAEQLYLELLEVQQDVFGREHSETLKSMVNLGGVYIAQERLDEGERLCVDALGVMRSTLGDEHPYTLAAKGRLCSLYSEQSRYDEAKSLLLDSYEQLQGNPEASPEAVHKTLGRIINLYEAWDAAEPGQGYAEQAAEWRAKLPAAGSDAAGNDAAPEPDTP